MSEYLVTIDHFRFSKDGSTLVVTSWRDTGFETTFDVPPNIDQSDQIGKELHERFYVDVLDEYEEYLS